MNKKKFMHPFLFMDELHIFDKRKVPVIGLNPVFTNRHHLYPKNREHFKGINKSKFLLRIWEHKHFLGWNKLFQFCYLDKNGHKKGFELIIDEIITHMIQEDPYMTSRVGTPAWKILFGKKKLHEAAELLCRMLSIKFQRQWRHKVCHKIHWEVRKAA